MDLKKIEKCLIDIKDYSKQSKENKEFILNLLNI